MHHHHHHGPRGTHPHVQPSKQGVQSPTTLPPKPKTTISSKLALEAVSNKPRNFLGDFIYEPGLKAQRLLPNAPNHRGFSSNPKPLPLDLIRDNENSVLTVKVARIHLSQLAREEITARAFIWGTEVYTDDSDVVAACIHGGWIRGHWPDDVDVSMLDLDQGSGANDSKRRKPKNQPSEPVETETEGLIVAPPAAGPMAVPENRDLHVNVLILPRLTKYSSVTRFGITSREFGGEFGGRHVIHDGLSFMIKSIRWVENGAQPQARLRGKGRRERMRKAMKEVKGSFNNVNGLDREQEKERISRLRGEITANWWRKEAATNGDKEPGERPASEGDKENQLAGDKPTVTSPENGADGLEKQDVEMADAFERKTTDEEAN